MGNITNDQTITAAQVQTVRLAAYELLTELNIMDIIIKKDVIPPVIKPTSTSSTISSPEEVAITEEQVNQWIGRSSSMFDDDFGSLPIG